MATILRMEQVYTDRIIHGPRVETAKTSNDVVHQGLVPGYSGTKLLDYKRYGSQGTSSNAAAACAYVHWDASADEERIYGPVRKTGTALSRRFELNWIAGQYGKPALNAVIALDENSNAAAHLASTVADRNFEVLGLNATTATVSAYAEGGLLFTTTTGANDQVILVPHLDTSLTSWTGVTWGTDQQTEWECDIQLTATITSITVWAGLKLTNTSVTATDADQVFFRFGPAVNSGKWQAIYSIGDTDTATDTGVAAVASTRYHFKIAIDSSRIARMWMNGVLYATSTALTNATDFIPYIGVETTTTAARTLRLHSQAISRAIA